MEIETATSSPRWGRRVAAGAVASVLSVLLMAGAAFAQTTTTAPYTGNPVADGARAQTDVLGFLGTLVSTVAPVLIAIALGVVGIFILGWGIRMVFHKVRSSAHF